MDQQIRFDIPAQPLAAALDAYATASGLEVLYDSELAAGRRSSAVRGLLLPDVALLTLLDGTGLGVFHTEMAFAIVPLPSGPRGGEPGGAGHMPFLALVQGSVEQAFCRNAETIPGQYRAALQFRIGGSGEVIAPRLLGTTGDLRRDTAITDILRGVRIAKAPPAGMPQPITMIVAPRPPDQTGDCGQMREQVREPARDRPARRGEP